MTELVGKMMSHYEEHMVAYQCIVFPLAWLLSAYMLFFLYAATIQWITETFI